MRFYFKKEFKNIFFLRVLNNPVRMSYVEYEEEYEIEEEYEDDLEPETIETIETIEEEEEEEELVINKVTECDIEEDEDNVLNIFQERVKKKIEQELLIETSKDKGFCLDEEDYL